MRSAHDAVEFLRVEENCFKEHDDTTHTKVRSIQVRMRGGGGEGKGRGRMRRGGRRGEGSAKKKRKTIRIMAEFLLEALGVADRLKTRKDRICRDTSLSRIRAWPTIGKPDIEDTNINWERYSWAEDCPERSHVSESLFQRKKKGVQTLLSNIVLLSNPRVS